MLKSGYTLIELLITISISAILITIGVTAYGRAAANQSIKTDTERILSTLGSAQKAATSGKTDCSSPYLGEYITISAGTNAMTVTSTCRDQAGTPRPITLTTGVFTSNNTLSFRPLNQGIDTGVGDSQNIDFMVGDNTYRIVVERGGSYRALGEVGP